MKQSIKVLNIKVMAAIIKQDGKIMKKHWFAIKTHNKSNQSEYDHERDPITLIKIFIYDRCNLPDHYTQVEKFNFDPLYLQIS